MSLEGVFALPNFVRDLVTDPSESPVGRGLAMRT